MIEILKPCKLKKEDMIGLAFDFYCCFFATVNIIRMKQDLLQDNLILVSPRQKKKITKKVMLEPVKKIIILSYPKMHKVSKELLILPCRDSVLDLMINSVKNSCSGK